MKFTTTSIAGVLKMDVEPRRDERGFFARTFCVEELAAVGVAFAPRQMSTSRNNHALTLRGMHFQPPPFAEAKIVRVTAGRAYEVILDLRVGSATFGKSFATELSAEGGEAVYIPEGCAHGFLTLTPDADVFYIMEKAFTPGHAAGVRWDDPAFAIRWPQAPKVIADADAAWPDWSDRETLVAAPAPLPAHSQ